MNLQLVDPLSPSEDPSVIAHVQDVDPQPKSEPNIRGWHMKDIEATRRLIDRAFAVAEDVFVVPRGRVPHLIFNRMRRVHESDEEVIARLERAYAIAEAIVPEPTQAMVMAIFAKQCADYDAITGLARGEPPSPEGGQLRSSAPVR